jgi:uncharacterized protein
MRGTLPRCFPLWLLLLLLTAAPAARSAAGPGLESPPIRDVRAGGEIGRRVDITLRNNLLALDADKDFLAPFEDKRASTGYVGLGKLIHSAVLLAAYSNDPRAIALKNRLVERTIAAQQPDGYIGMFASPSRMGELWDVHEIAYLVFGLVSDYELFGSAPSLTAATKAADYVLVHWSRIPADWGTRTGVATHVAVTGLERAVLALYRATSERRFLDFVLDERALASWDLPIVVGRRPGIEGHIFAFMARSLAQLELFPLRPDPRLAAQADRAVAFLTAGNGMAITGGAGQYEIWTDDQDGRGDLAETCATAYQIRIYDTLLRMRGEPRYGDLMERTIYNTLFAAQSPDGRRIRYFSPLEGPRVYHPGDTYCCPTNYRRIVAELPRMIYYRTPDAVVVNLYTPSEAKLAAGGTTVRVRQETAYPSDGAVTVRLDPAVPATFTLRLRIPSWTAGAGVVLNDHSIVNGAVPGRFLDIGREWRAGDRIRLTFPMPVRIVRGRERQSGRVAVMRGPQVFCLNPAQSKTFDGADGADLGRYTLDPATFETVADDSVRPGGVAVRGEAWKPGFDISLKHDLKVTFTEFPDPGGRATYFRLRDYRPAVEDELFVRTTAGNR